MSGALLVLVGFPVLGALPVIAIVLFVITFSEPEYAPPDPTDAVGVRLDDGVLTIWPGARCEDVSDLEVYFSPSDDPVAHTLRLDAEEGAFSEPFRLDDLPAEVEVDQALPDDFDLDDHGSVTVRGARMVAVSLDPVRAGSESHPDEYWFGESFGWLTEQEAAARDGDDLNGACTSRD